MICLSHLNVHNCGSIDVFKFSQFSDLNSLRPSAVTGPLEEQARPGEVEPWHRLLLIPTDRFLLKVPRRAAEQTFITAAVAVGTVNSIFLRVLLQRKLRASHHSFQKEITKTTPRTQELVLVVMGTDEKYVRGVRPEFYK